VLPLKTECNKLVILAGGISSRMKQSKSSLPANADLVRQVENFTKGMIGVGDNGRPLMDYLLFNARQSGIDDVVIVVGEHDGSIRQHYGLHEGNNHFHGLRISYAIQRIPEGRNKPGGTADALLQAFRVRQEWKSDSALVCNSDNLYSSHAMSLLVRDDSANALIAYDRDGLQFDQHRIAAFGVVRTGDDSCVKEIVEKPSLKEIDGFRGSDGILRVSMNIFKLHYDTVLPFLEECPEDPDRKEKELPVALNIMVQRIPGTIKAIPLREHVPDLTYRDDIETLREYLANHVGVPEWGRRDIN
jgi:glucose-1-phosphate thymidylyltransferase